MAYFATNVNIALADRFELMFKDTIEKIQVAPELGVLYAARSKKTRGLRFRKMTRFKKHLVFYRITRNVVEIVRVLHGARNLDRILRKGE
jgi:toxin ParE1/3/4